MQRQSLGSPASRSGGVGGSGGATELARPEKAIRPPASASGSSRAVVHAVPIATLLCFLVLYLLSHDPALESFTRILQCKTTQRSLAPKRRRKDFDAGNGGAESVVPKKKAVSGIYIGGGGGVSAARGLMEERRLRHRKDPSAPARHVRSS